MANSLLWMDRSLLGEAGNPERIGVMIPPESSSEWSLEAVLLIDFFMGAIHGFDSTPNEECKLAKRMSCNLLRIGMPPAAM